MMKKEFALKI